MAIRVENGKKPGSFFYHCEDGYFYYFNNGNDYGDPEGNAGMLLHLRCKNRYKRLCMGTAKIEVTPQGSVWTNLMPHTCPRNLAHQHVTHLRQEILAEAVENFNRPYESPAALVERVRSM